MVWNRVSSPAPARVESGDEAGVCEGGAPDIIGVGSSGAKPSPEPRYPACQVLTLFPSVSPRFASTDEREAEPDEAGSARLLLATPGLAFCGTCDCPDQLMLRLHLGGGGSGPLGVVAATETVIKTVASLSKSIRVKRPIMRRSRIDWELCCSTAAASRTT